jgi:hypothetical protein
LAIVREARSVVIAGRREEDLRLVLQAPEGLRVDDPIAVALKRRTDGIFGLRTHPALRRRGPRRLRRQRLEFPGFELFTDGHATPSAACDIPSW